MRVKPDPRVGSDESPRKRSKRAARELDTRALIEEQFQHSIVVRVNGKRTKMSGFEAVYRQLLNREVSGDRRAFKVRLLYEKFAESRRGPTERKTIIIGGLPDDDDV